MNAHCRVRMAFVDQWRPHDNRLHQLTRALCITRTPWAERTIEASKPIQERSASAAATARCRRGCMRPPHAIAATLHATQALVVALALAPAAAFVGPAPAAPSTVMKESLSDLKALQQSLPGPPNDYFDPLNLATMTFDWGPQGEEVLPRRRISPFRGAAAPSRHRRASSSREEVVGGFFSDFE